MVSNVYSNYFASKNNRRVQFGMSESKLMPKYICLRHFTFDQFHNSVIMSKKIPNLISRLRKKNPSFCKIKLCSCVFTSHSQMRKYIESLKFWNSVTVFCYDDCVFEITYTTNRTNANNDSLAKVAYVSLSLILLCLNILFPR